MVHRTDFASLHLSVPLLQVARELGYEKMTPIQAQCIPLLLEGRDLIGQAKTGSGKTAAFVLPILEKLNLHGQRLQALILCPTRELCMQVAREVRKLGRHHPGLQVLTISGGQPIFTQLNSLEKGVHVVVGTPGRVLDHLRRKTLDFNEITFLVLDEADRMLDMGFQEDMERILKAIPKTRQTMFFSATFPQSIESMSQAYQRKPARVTIEENEQSSPQITQVFYEITLKNKFKALLWLLHQNHHESALIFCNLKTTAMDLSRVLSGVGMSTSCLHGDLEQSARDRVMTKFRNLSTRILIATDIASRGIDVECLDLVFNFDLPAKPDIYVHRIGRTGRAGKRGLAISIGIARDKGIIQVIEKFTGVQIVHKTLPSVEKYDVELLKKNVQREARMETIFISGGRKDKMRPGDILGALTGEAGKLDASKIGKIEIYDRFSYVAVTRSVAQVAIQSLRNGRIKGRRFRIEPVL